MDTKESTEKSVVLTLKGKKKTNNKPKSWGIKQQYQN